MCSYDNKSGGRAFKYYTKLYMAAIVGWNTQFYVVFEMK